MRVLLAVTTFLIEKGIVRLSHNNRNYGKKNPQFYISHMFIFAIPFKSETLQDETAY